MNGRILMIGMLVFAALFGVALWWFQTRAYYTEVGPDHVPGLAGQFAISDWQGIDASSSPLKFRACFRIPEADAQRFVDDNYEIANATPLVAPDWFPCFDAGRLTEDLASGRAEGYFMGASGHDGVDRYMALYRDGRAYLWHQLNERFSD